MSSDLKSEVSKKCVEFNDEQPDELTINNNLDRAILQILKDAKNENDEPLRMLEKSLFDPNTVIERLDIADSIILKLAYMKKTWTFNILVLSMESIVLNLWENICGVDNCLTHKEIISTIFGGILTGVSAIIIYVFQKHVENKSNKHSTATILHGEVKRILDIHNIDESVQIMAHMPKRLPTNQIYQGLLHSGNIKYFDGNLQDKLDEMYTIFKIDSLSPQISYV